MLSRKMQMAVPQGGGSGPPSGATLAVWEAGNPNIILTDNDLTMSSNHSGLWRNTNATIGKSEGKWSWEITHNLGAGTADGVYTSRGIANSSQDHGLHLGSTLHSIGIYHNLPLGGTNNGYILADIEVVDGALPDPIVNGDVVTILLDMDNKRLRHKVNGVLSFADYDFTANPKNAIYPAGAIIDRGGIHSMTINCGQTPLLYPEEGYNAGLWTV